MARTPRTVRVALSGEQNTAGGKPIPWMLAAIGGAITVAVASWAGLVGLSITGWLGSPEFGFGTPLRLGTGFWLLANGGSLRIGQTPFTILPLGVSAVIILMIQGVAGYAAQQAREAKQLNRQVVWRLVGWFTLTYLSCVVLAAFATNQTNNLVRMIVVTIIMAAFPSLSICLKIAGLDLKGSWPAWAGSIPRATQAAVLVVAVGAGLTLAMGLVLSYDRIIALHDSLNPGFIGSLLLTVVQLAYLPNLLAWCAAWVLGAGFSIGQGSVISPGLTEVGLLPNVPVFAAVPSPGVGTGAAMWWVAFGVIAGGLAGFMVVRARPKARFEETSLVSGLSGLIAGLLIVAVCAISNGGMGDGRLNLVGARMPELLAIAPGLLGISGLLVGLAFGLVRYARTRREQKSEAENQPTPHKTGKRQTRTRNEQSVAGSAPASAKVRGSTATTEDWSVGDEQTGTASGVGSGESSQLSQATAGAMKKETSTLLSKLFGSLKRTDRTPGQKGEEQTQPFLSDDQGTEPTARVRPQE